MDFPLCLVSEVSVALTRLPISRILFPPYLSCIFPSFYSGPRDEYTHWKQTVFYLDQELVANKNESISGTIAVQRNPKNPRDLDIKLSTKFQGKEQAAIEQERLYRLR